MASLLSMDLIGPRGESLALATGDELDIPVGIDSEFNCATFDAESLAPEELEQAVSGALTKLDPDWQAHLRVIDD